jgi:hypothetical protein
LGRRLRRNYLWIYVTVGLAWFARVALFPSPVSTFTGFVTRASIGPLGGQWVIMFVAILLAAMVAIGLFTVGLRHSSGEVLPRYGLPEGFFDTGEKTLSEEAPWYRITRRRRQILTFIITDKPQQLSESILEKMRRGATMVSGKGAFTKKEHSVLMCALTITEIPHLKALVSEVDESAFVIVIPAQEVFGKGFMPLENE